MCFYGTSPFYLISWQIPALVCDDNGLIKSNLWGELLEEELLEKHVAYVSVCIMPVTW